MYVIIFVIFLVIVRFGWAAAHKNSYTCRGKLRKDGQTFHNEKEWYSGCYADNKDGPRTLHRIHWTCVDCGLTFGDKPYGDITPPILACDAVLTYTPDAYTKAHPERCTTIEKMA